MQTVELICPECKSLKQTSQLVELFNGSGTLGATNNFVDEQGISHWHNPNFNFRLLRCSNGHDLKNTSYYDCNARNCTFKGGTARLVSAPDLLKEFHEPQ